MTSGDGLEGIGANPTRRVFDADAQNRQVQIVLGMAVGVTIDVSVTGRRGCHGGSFGSLTSVTTERQVATGSLAAMVQDITP